MGLITQLRQDYRIFDMALFDWVLATLATYFILIYLGIDQKSATYGALPLAALLGIVSHLFTGTPTMLNYYLGLSEKPEKESEPVQD